MDIASLMSELQATQQAKSTVRLSERNVVELINKLKQLGLLGDDLLHTINGKEYITTVRLRSEIQKCLNHSGGRLALVELPALIGVDLFHCEKQATALVEASSGNMIETQGELMTTTYFDSMAAEVNDLLQESGMMILGDIAVQYAMSSELLIKTIASRVGIIIKGRMEGGLIYTPAYLRNIKAQLRGALRGITAPTVVNTLIKELDLEAVGGGGGGGVIPSLVEELIAEGSVKGVLKGGGASWVPDVHAEAQQGSVTAFYTQNGWVAYDTVKKVGITNEMIYLAGKFPDGIALETAFVAPSLLLQLEAAVEEAVASDSWLDVAPLLPSVLTPADTSALLKKVPLLSATSKTAGGGKSKSKGASAAAGIAAATTPLVLASSCVVSQHVFNELQEAANAAARKAAEKAISERRAPSTAASSQPAGSASGAGGKKGAGADDDDDWGLGNKKGGKKGKGGAKGGATKSGGAASGKGGAKSGGEAAPAAGLGLQDMETAVYDARNELDAGADGSLIPEIAQLVLPGALLEYEKQLQAVLTAGADDKRRAKDAIVKNFEEAFQRLALYGRGVDVFIQDEQTYATLQKHVARSVGVECVDLLFQFARSEYQQQVQDAASKPSSTVSAAERTKLLKVVPPDVATSLGQASELPNNNSMQEIESGMEQAAGEIGIRLKKFDKKAEKAAVLGCKQSLLDALLVEQEPAAAFSLVVPLLFIKAMSKAINIPGKAFGSVLAKLKEHLPEDVLAPAEEFHSKVFEYLKAQGGGGTESQELAEVLTQKLPGLKALVLGGPADSSASTTTAAAAEALAGGAPTEA